MTDQTPSNCNHPASARLPWKSQPDDIEPHVNAQLCTRCGRLLPVPEAKLVTKIAKEVNAVIASLKQ